MGSVASRELRNRTRSLLDRVVAGESITITVDGRPVAVPGPVARRPRWMARGEATRLVLSRQADPHLSDDLRDLAGEMTDEVPLQ